MLSLIQFDVNQNESGTNCIITLSIVISIQLSLPFRLIHSMGVNHGKYIHNISSKPAGILHVLSMIMYGRMCGTISMRTTRPNCSTCEYIGIYVRNKSQRALQLTYGHEAGKGVVK
jgi:hypothetical protein